MRRGSASGNRRAGKICRRPYHSASSSRAISGDRTGAYYANPSGAWALAAQSRNRDHLRHRFHAYQHHQQDREREAQATLPPYVRWVGIYSPASEDLTFNQNDSTVTWDIGTIEPGVGMNGAPPRQAAIAIGFTPSTSQIGQEPPLLQVIGFSGVDAATGLPCRARFPT